MDIVLIPEMEFSGSTESPEAVGHAMITAQNRPNTEKSQRRVPCTGTQIDVLTHTDFKVKTDVWSKLGEDQVIVREKPVIKAKGLEEGNPVNWKINTGAANMLITEEV